MPGDAGLLTVAGVAGVLLVLSAVAGLVLAASLRRLARRLGIAVLDGSAWNSPVVVLSVAATLQAYGMVLAQPWSLRVAHLLGLVLVAAVGWLLLVLVATCERAALARVDRRAADPHVRHVRTQVVIVSRVASALIVAVTVGLVLWRIPAVRELGAGVLASAGVLSVIAGVAAQTTLGNVFAGLQLAFTDAIRVADIISFDGRWGTVEEVALTYVVLRLPDRTTVIMPSSYFTVTPFRNWTHAGSTMVGEVTLVVGFEVDLDAVRSELRALAAASAYWDGDMADLVVTSWSTEGIELRALLSTARGQDVDRFCWEIREGLVRSLRRDVAALPRLRHEPTQRDDARAGAGTDRRRS